jgi:hypothetical protein
MHAELRDQGEELLLKSEIGNLQYEPILGLLQVNNFKNNEIRKAKEPDSKLNTSGRIVVYGDSNCIDDSHSQKRNY